MNFRNIKGQIGPFQHQHVSKSSPRCSSLGGLLAGDLRGRQDGAVGQLSLKQHVVERPGVVEVFDLHMAITDQIVPFIYW